MDTKDLFSFVSDTLTKLKSTINVLEMVVGELYQRSQNDRSPTPFVNVSSHSRFVHGQPFAANQITFQEHQQKQQQQQFHQPQQETQKQVIFTEIQTNADPLAVSDGSTKIVLTGSLNHMTTIVNGLLDNSIFREIEPNTDEDDADVFSQRTFR